VEFSFVEDQAQRVIAAGGPGAEDLGEVIGGKLEEFYSE
jgi:hypothetical protein